MTQMLRAAFDLKDLLALAWLVAAWFGYPHLLAFLGRMRPSVNLDMLDIRRNWMARMLERENRIVDAALIGQVLQSVAFFASGTVIVVGALLGAIANADRLVTIASGVDAADRLSIEQVQVKLLVLAVIFVYGFFKFTWTIRQFNYCVAMIGAAPLPPVEAVRSAALAEHMGEALSHASEAFNAGLRAYYFAFAALAWFASPFLVPVSTTVMLAVLIRRQLASTAMRAIHESLAEIDPVAARRPPDPTRLD